MKKNDFKNLKNKKLAELKKLVSEKKTELLKYLSKKASGGEKNLKKAKNSRKEIAQVSTIIREMEIVKKEETK